MHAHEIITCLTERIFPYTAADGGIPGVGKHWRGRDGVGGRGQPRHSGWAQGAKEPDASSNQPVGSGPGRVQPQTHFALPPTRGETHATNTMTQLLSFSAKKWRTLRYRMTFLLCVGNCVSSSLTPINHLTKRRTNRTKQINSALRKSGEDGEN